MTRTRIALPAILTSTALLLAACGSGNGTGTDPTADGTDAAESGPLVVSTFAFGAEAFDEAIVKPFEEATGYTVEVETGNNADRLSTLRVAGDRNEVDVILISDFYAAMGEDQDLFQAVDADKIPALTEIADFAVNDAFSGPAYTFQLNGILHRTADVTAQRAADWDLFADDSLAGRLAFPDITTTGGQLSVAAVGEVYGDDAYDIDTALSTLAGWRSNILQFTTSSTELTNLIVQGEVVAAPTLNAFATELVNDGSGDFAWTAPEKGRFMATNRALIPAAAPHPQMAHEFINYLLGVEAQQKSAELVGDLPVNPGATVPAKLTAVVGDLAADPTAGGYKTLDTAVIVANYDAWTERFAREVTAR